MSNHTPGPWEVKVLKQITPKRDIYMITKAARNPDESSEANAHLMAAAPELLESAVLARDIMYSSLENQDAWLAVRDALEAAIDKAEGE